MTNEGPDSKWTIPENAAPLLDTPPPGFQVVRSGQHTFTIHHRRTGMGCMNGFLMFWLTGWTVGCVWTQIQYLGGGKMEDGSPIQLWLVGGIWFAELVVALLSAVLIFERRTFLFEEDALTIRRDILGMIWTNVVSKSAVTGITQFQDGGTGEDSFPSWGLRGVAGKSQGLIFRQPYEQSAWLGQITADWANMGLSAARK